MMFEKCINVFIAQCYLTMLMLAGCYPPAFSPADTVLIITYNNATISQWYEEGQKFTRNLSIYPILKAKVCTTLVATMSYTYLYKTPLVTL